MRVITAVLVMATTTVSFAQSGQSATATLKSVQGETVGEATLTDTPNGVLVRVHLTSAPAGVHAFHVHETGKCEPPFTSAGGHLNPGKKQHGVLNAMGMHAGDLPNITVPGSGDLTFDMMLRDVTLKAGPSSLLDADGSAVVIHDKADDYASDPAGNAGDRIICGVVARG
jgi:superoxide dismutase, Cu-Zn family